MKDYKYLIDKDQQHQIQMAQANWKRRKRREHIRLWSIVAVNIVLWTAILHSCIKDIGG